MLPLADFEARFFAALGALASLLLHAALLLLFLATPADEPAPSPRVVVAIVSDPPPAADPLLGSPAPAPPEPSATVADVADVAAVADDDAAAESVAMPLVPADGSEGYRELLRRREAAFQRDMALRERRVAALERFLSAQGAASTEAGGPGSHAPDEVRACGARGAGDVVAVRAQRSMARYADVVPVGLFPPQYLDQVAQVEPEAERSLGFVEMALPPREVIIQLDAPSGAVFAVGRRDARCLVGFSWSPKVFPLTFRSLPARYVGPDDEIREVRMDVRLSVDGSFDVEVREGDALPFTRGVLYDQRAVARNLQQRATGARLVRDFLGALFGGGDGG